MNCNLLFFNIFIVPLSLSACQSEPPLNSERIAARYGNYGVDVIRANDSRRVSSLYSGTDSSKTMRTMAVVDFQAAADSRVREEHAAIVAGGSIGEVFKERGWEIDKHVIELCEQKFSAETLPSLGQMHTELPRQLAVYKYRFVVTRAGEKINYAEITEVYHPDYLSFEQLLAQNAGKQVTPGQTICSSSVAE